VVKPYQVPVAFASARGHSVLIRLNCLDGQAWPLEDSA
jgi:hypothetical protein